MTGYTKITEAQFYRYESRMKVPLLAIHSRSTDVLHRRPNPGMHLFACDHGLSVVQVGGLR